MLYNNIYKLFLILFIQIFFIKLNEIKKGKIFIKYNQLNKIKNIVRQKGENIYKYNIKSIKMIKKVVYSVIIGDYDNISPFPFQEGFDYFLFSDVIYNNTNWTIIPISKLKEKVNISGIKITRYIKLFPHLFFKDYELSIYFDGSLILNGDLNELLLRILNPNFNLYLLQHPLRNKVFQELSAVVFYKKDTKEAVDIIEKRYVEINFPDNLGLTENCIIIRRHNKKDIIKLMEVWWNEIKNYSYRDQLSLNFAIWKLNLTIKIYYLSKKFMLDYFTQKDHLKVVEY
jgi:hypothetical protein